MRHFIVALLPALVLGLAHAETVRCGAQDKKDAKAIRVLLLASGPTRDFCFLHRELIERSADKGLKISTLLQVKGGFDEFGGRETVLESFPDQLEAKEKGSANSLASYDVIIAIDADWSALGDADQPGQRCQMVKQWVHDHGGGIVFVAGPINTPRVARQIRKELAPLEPLLPVKLKEAANLRKPGKAPPQPFALRLNPDVRLPPFMKLTREEDDPFVLGWSRFFWDDTKPKENTPPLRGFLDAYPVASVAKDAEVLATLVGPEEPFLVQRRCGKGTTLYIGSPEIWRLHQFRNAYHERFWLETIRHLAAKNKTS